MLQRLPLALLLILSTSPGAVSAQVPWPNEPPGSTPLVDCTFDTLDCGGQLWNVYNSGAIVEDGSAPGSPPKVGRAVFSIRRRTGGLC